MIVSNPDLIYQELFDDGEHDWNFTTNSNTAYPTISNCDDNSANNCLYLRDKSTAWIEISTVNYTRITVLYDIYISNNWENCTVDDCLMDKGIIGYSCGNNVIRGMNYYTANTINDIAFINVSYHLRNECSDISNMKLYVISMLIRNYDKYLSIGNIRIYGEHKEYQKSPILPTPLFSDDFTNEYSENWDHLDMFVFHYNGEYCIDNPCVRLAFGGGIRIANGISTIGYENIRLNYDIAIDRDYDGNINDTFRVYYSCDDNYEINIKTYSGNIFPVFILGEEILLPSLCDNVDNVTIRFQSESQFGNAYIDNVNIYGSIIENNPTSTPTIEPTNIPTNSPSKAPTMTPTVSPSINPTGSPTFIPSGSPTNIPTKSPSTAPTMTPTVSPTKIPTNSILALSTLNPTAFQAPLQTDTLQRMNVLYYVFLFLI